MSEPVFKKATPSQAKARIALMGPAGYGKTWTSLTLAKTLGDKVGVLDTEFGSASKYARHFDFSVAELGPPYHPERYINRIKEAADNGFDVLVIDSLSHEWNGKGGVLELVDEFAKKEFNGKTFYAWSKVTPMHRKLVDAMLSAPMHIIVTMRSKTKYVIDESPGQKSKVSKVGVGAQQRDDLDFEFDIFGEFIGPAEIHITKTRCNELHDKLIEKPGKELGETILGWLRGEEPPVDSGAA